MAAAKQMQTGKDPAPSAVVRADAAQRAQRAWTARVSGSTWDEAAKVAGYADAATACRGVKNYFGQLPVVERDDLRDVWRARMELLWTYAARDAKKGKPGALRAGTAIAQRAAAMDGLDEPTSIAVSASDRQDMDEMVRTLAVLMGIPQEASIWDDDVVDAEVIGE